MVRTERRQAPRMTVKELAYVNLDRDNGGVILNISEGGLCFQATAPVRRTEIVRLWFCCRSQRIEAKPGHVSRNAAQTIEIPGFIETESQLTWGDDTQKKGGLRFVRLPAEARQQIRDWIRQPSLVKINEKYAPSSMSSYRESAALSEALFRHVRSGRLWTGFSGGLMAGVLTSAIVVGLFLSLSHTRQLGDSLVQLGERLGGRSWAGSQAPHSTAPGPPPVSPEPKTGPAELQTSAAAAVQAPLPKKLVPTARPAAANPSGVELEGASHGTLALSAPSVKFPGALELNKPLIPEIVASPLEPSASMFAATAPEIAPAIRPGVHIEPSKAGSIGMHSEKYLEIGKFKEKLLADQTTLHLSHLGFPASVIQRGRLFGKSYQVLVGPYETDLEAEAIHKNLTSRGFAPRSYERGKRDLSLPPALKVGNTHLPVGYCTISWESYSPNAIVKFENSEGTSVTVEGKWVNKGEKYPHNAVAYVKNRDGSRTLVEIRFYSMARTLVFGGG
jgi:hypothetical protein